MHRVLIIDNGRELTRAMNGSIAVSSAPGKGTCVTLHFSKAL